MRLLPCLLCFAAAASLTLAQAPVAPKPGTKDADKDKAKDKPKGDKPAKLPPSPLDKVEGYKRSIVEGFTLMMSAEADEADGKGTETKPKDALAAELMTLRKLLSAKQVESLQRMPIWIDWDEYEALKSGREGRAIASFETADPMALNQAKKNPYRSKCLIVHSLKMLTEGHPAKAEGSPVLMLRAVSRWMLEQIGSENPLVKNGYRSAMEHKLYDRAQNVTTNHYEFFAELSCAHFDQLGHYPKTREELKKHDPASAALLDGIWGAAKKPVKPATQPSKPKALADLSGSDKFDLAIGHAGVQWGNSIHGPEFKIDDAKESIILLATYGGDEWIVLEKLARMHEELSPYGMRILAVPPPAADADLVKKQLAERDVEFTALEKAAVVQKDGQFAAEKPGGAILFDAEGKCLFRGSAYEVLPHIRAAVAKKILAKAMPGEAPKSLAAFADAFSQGSLSMPEAIPKIAPSVSSSDAEVATIAKAIAAELLAPALALLAEAQTQAKPEPFAAFQTAEKIALRYRGTSVAAKATALMDSLKLNATVAPELKARVLFDPIRKLDAALMTQPNSYSTLDDKFQKPNEQAIAQLIAQHVLLKKKYPMAKATADASKIVTKYSLTE